MGLCGSSEASASDNENQPVPKPHAVSEKKVASDTQPASSATSSPISASSDDSEYFSQLKSIYLFLLDRLLQTMEYEREGMNSLAALHAGVGSSYLTLFNAPAVESYLRSIFNLKAIPTANPSASPIEKEASFAALVKASQIESESGAVATPRLSRKDFTTQIKQVCAKMQQELTITQSVLKQHQSSLNRSDELATHIAFFIKTLNFVQGDIANDAKLLEKNIDEIINAKM